MRTLLLLLLLAVPVAPALATSLTAEHAWLRSPPPGATMLAGYARLTNSGNEPLRIVGARSVAFGDVQLHETIEQEGVSRMRPVEQLTIAPGQTVELQPGGLHLMLMQPRRKLGLGDSVLVDLLTADGDPLPILLNVRVGPDATAEAVHAH